MISTKRTILLILVFGFLASNVFGQIQKLDWKLLNSKIESPKKLSNDSKQSIDGTTFSINYDQKTKDSIIPIEGKNEKHFQGLAKGKSKFVIDLKGEATDVTLSLLKFSWIIKGGDINSHKVKLTVDGFSSTKSIEPIFTSIDELEKQSNTLIFERGLVNELGINFTSPVSKIEFTIETDEQVKVFFELSPIYKIPENQLIVDNSPLEISNCDNVNINIVLDGSHSMSDEEKEDVRIGILDFLEDEILDASISANVAFVEFGKGSEVGLSYQKLDKQSIESGGIINDYLFNIYGNNLDSKNNWTNWGDALELVAEMNSVDPANLMLFITDGVPNGNTSKKTTQPERIEEIINYANQIKESGTHIYAFGNGNLKEDVAKLWFGWLTNGETSKLNDDETSIANIDYFELNSFKEIPQSLSDALMDCKSATELDLEANLTSQNSSKLTWLIQDELSKNDFQIFRSNNKSDWERIDGQITSNENNFIFHDESPVEGKNYYQVKSNKNGTELTSPIRSVKVQLEKLVNVFPNPAKSNVDVILSKDLLPNISSYQIELKDLLGKSLNIGIERTESGFKLQTEGLGGGTYFLNVVDGNEVIFTERLIIIQ